MYTRGGSYDTDDGGIDYGTTRTIQDRPRTGAGPKPNTVCVKVQACGISEDVLNCYALTGIRPMVETFPLEQAAAAYDRMLSGKARCRVVLTMK